MNNLKRTDPGKQTTPLQAELERRFPEAVSLEVHSLPNLRDYVHGWDEPIPADGEDWPHVDGDTYAGPMPSRIEVQGE